MVTSRRSGMLQAGDRRVRADLNIAGMGRP